MTAIEKPKPKNNFYDVNLSRDTSEEITIRVKAVNVIEAREKAQEEAESNFDLNWNQTDYVGHVQADLVSIVFPSRRKKDEEKEPVVVFNASEANMTNIEKITDIMEYSQYGALAQMFVMDAVGKLAKIVAEATEADLEPMKNGFIDPYAWQNVAKEIQVKLAAYQPKNIVFEEKSV